MKNVEQAVIELIRIQPLLSMQVREELMKQGYKKDEIKRAISNLWDSGKLNVGNDLLLRPT